MNHADRLAQLIQQSLAQQQARQTSTGPRLILVIEDQAIEQWEEIAKHLLVQFACTSLETPGRNSPGFAIQVYVEADNEWIPWNKIEIAPGQQVLADLDLTTGTLVVTNPFTDQVAPNRRADYEDDQDPWQQHQATTERASMWPEPTTEAPDLETLEDWIREGGCEATDGCWVEADNVCEHSHPSWLLRLGLI